MSNEPSRFELGISGSDSVVGALDPSLAADNDWRSWTFGSPEHAASRVSQRIGRRYKEELVPGLAEPASQSISLEPELLPQSPAGFGLLPYNRRIMDDEPSCTESQDITSRNDIKEAKQNYQVSDST